MTDGESGTQTAGAAPGLLRKVTSIVLDHYGYAPKATAPAVPAGDNGGKAPTVAHDKPLFSPWAARGSTYGLPMKRAPLELIASYRSWIYSCVRVISYRVAGLPLMLILNQRDLATGEVSRAEVDAHPFLDMLWKPNRFTTRMELWLTTMNHLNLTGNAYWLVLRDRLRVPREIWPLYPQYMRMIPDQVNFIKGYVYTAVSPPIRFDLDNPDYRVVHFKFPNPLNPYYGMGPVEAQAYAYDLDLYTEIYQRNFFQEGARPDFVLESDQIVTKDDAELTWALWEERHKGVAKSWRPAILGSGLKAKPLNVSNRDLAFAALADWSRDKIISAFGVPAAKLGLVIDVNRANADAADLTFNREAVLPQIQLVEERIELDIVSEYPGQTSDTWLEADFKNPVPEDRETKLKERETYLRTGKNVINEFREEDGEDPVAWGDLPLLPLGTAPLGSAPATPATPGGGEEPKPPAGPAPATPGAEPTETPEEAYARKTALWEEWVRKVGKHERRLHVALRVLFVEQGGRVLEKLAEVGPKTEACFNGWSGKKVRAALEDPGKYRVPEFIAQVLAVLHIDREKWVTKLTDSITASVDEAGENTIGSIGVGVWDLYDPIVQRWIEERGGNKIKDIEDTTKLQLRETLIDGMANGEGAAKLAARVRDVFTQADLVRSLRIARTETHTSANFGQRQAWKQSGVVTEKEWLSARDERVRETHKHADGQTVPLDGLFTVGEGRGPAPGEIGRAEEDINCRCTMLAVIAKDAKTGRVILLRAPGRTAVPAAA